MANSYAVAASTTEVALTETTFPELTFTITRTGGTNVAETVPWTITHAPTLYGTLFKAVDYGAGSGFQTFAGSKTAFPSGTIQFAANQTSKVVKLKLGDGNFGEALDGRGYTFGFKLDIAGVAAPTISDSASGGVGVTERFYTIRGGGGTFTMSYENYSIPDREDIYVNDVLAATTGGQVSGTGSLVVGGSILPAGTRIRTVVTGTDSGTAWDYRINYVPGIVQDTAASVHVTLPGPSVLDLAQLSSDAYNTRPKGNAFYSAVAGGELFFKGLHVVAYRDADTSHVVIAIRGTYGDERAFLAKNLATDTSFGTGVADASLHQIVSQTSDFIRRIADRFTGEKITLTGHSLGGGVAQIIGKAANIDAQVFDAPGGGALIGQLALAGDFSSLAPIVGSSPGLSVNHRMRGDPVSQFGQVIGTTKSYANPENETVNYFLKSHSIDALARQIENGASSTPGYPDPSYAGVLQSAINLLPVVAPGFFAGVVGVQLGVDAYTNYKMDPSWGSTFTLTLGDGSPKYRYFTPPVAPDVTSYSVATLFGGGWSSPGAAAPGAALTFGGAGVDGIRFTAFGPTGQVAVLPSAFIYDLGFASAGTASVKMSSLTKAYDYDFNRDGVSDVFWQSDAGLAAAWVQTGLQVRDAALQSPLGSTWRIAGIGDVNADGRADAVWQNDKGQALLWLMDGADPVRVGLIGGANGSNWQIRAVGDINGDTRADLVWEDDKGQAVVFYMDGQTVNGGITVGAPRGANWQVRAVGDLNADGLGDLIWQNSAGQASVWLMNATSVNSAQNVGAPYGPDYQIMGTGDFNGDGRADIVWEGPNGQAVVWHMSGTVAISSALLGGPNGPDLHIKQIADMNGDGKVDLVWQNAAGQATVWLMNGNAVQSTAALGPANGSAWSVATNNPRAAAHDFDGDGRADLLWSSDGGLTSIFRMNGTEITSGTLTSLSPGPGWTARGGADLNGDGRADIIYQNGGGQTVGVIMNGPNVLSAAPIGGALGSTWKVVGSGDLNADGMSDIVVQDEASGLVVSWLMNGTTLTQAAAAGPASPGATVRAIGDLNGDDRADLIFELPNGQAVAWYMNGPTFSSAALLGPANGSGVHIRGAGDLNGDGRVELLWETDNGQAVAWRMNGSNVQSAALIGPANGPGWDIAEIFDTNGDGREDIVWQSTGGQGAVWLMNDFAIQGASLVGPANGADWHIA